MGGQGDMSPLLFEVEGTPCVLSPLLSGVDILVMHNCAALITLQFLFASCYYLLVHCSLKNSLILTVTGFSNLHCIVHSVNALIYQ